MGTKLIIRKARPADAEAVARITSSPGVTPILGAAARLLSSMTIEGQSARWRNAIALAAREAVYVAEDHSGRIIGMTSMGRARDSGLGYDAEIYTLYVDPLMTGAGIGRALLAGAFEALSEAATHAA
jgi:GNAT superfamily N-acetyltransferase